jgi:two-component system chemotaxis sensor kinase CheA
MHLLRNAVTHGIGTPADRAASGKPAAGAVRLRVDSVGDRLNITVEDDGRGIDAEAVLREAAAEGVRPISDSREDVLNLIFRPGLSTSRQVTRLAGRGMGLSVVQQGVSRLQGEVRVGSQKGGGTVFTISAPLSVSTHHVLLLAVGGFGYFIVSAPPAVKLICAAALLYSLARTAWGFWKA